MDLLKFGRRTGRWMTMLVAVALVAGCKIAGDGTNTPANVRFVNLMSDQSTLSVKVDGNALASDLTYQSLSAYKEKASGTYDALVSNAAGTTLATYPLGFGQNKSTFYFYGTAGVMAFARVIEDTATLSAGKFVVRTLRLAPNLAALDLYVTEAATDISGVSPIASAGGVGLPSNYSVETNAGTYRVRLTTAGTKSVVFDSTVTFVANTINTLVLHSLGSAQVPVVLWMQPGEGTAKVLPNALARVRVVQASEGSGFSMVDGPAFDPVSYGAIGNYVTAASGNRVFSCPGAPSASNYNFLPGRDYTIFCLGNAPTSAVVFEENSNELQAGGKLRGSFINATTDQASINVLVNGQAQVSALGSGKASTWQVLTAAATPVSYTTASGGVLAQQTTDVLLVDTSYRFALIGKAGNYRTLSYLMN